MKVRAFLVILLVFAFAGAAAAQIDTGAAYVTVTSCAGTNLPGVTLTLSGNGIAPHVDVTNAEGQGRFPGLAPGDYTLKSQLEGFATATTPVSITQGHNTEVPVTLLPAVCETTPSDASCCSQSKKEETEKKE